MLSPQQLGLCIGDIPLRLYVSDEALHDKARGRYAHFLHNAVDALPIFLNSAAGGWRDESRFAYVWEKCSLRLGDKSARFDGVRHEYGLDSLIRILLSVLLAPERGFLLHAATIVRDSHAFVFTGKSGAGKSTIASLSPRESVLTDEISLLRVVNGAWSAFGTPFWGEFRAEGANVHAPIAGLYFLNQSTDDGVEKITAREAVRLMLPNILFFSRDRQRTEDLLRLLSAFVDSIPFYRLFFRKDDHFWSLLTV